MFGDLKRLLRRFAVLFVLGALVGVVLGLAFRGAPRPGAPERGQDGSGLSGVEAALWESGIVTRWGFEFEGVVAGVGDFSITVEAEDGTQFTMETDEETEFFGGEPDNLVEKVFEPGDISVGEAIRGTAVVDEQGRFRAVDLIEPFVDDLE